MQCPRCSEEAPDNSAECPVCQKPFPIGNPAATVRLTLTGEALPPEAFTRSVETTAVPLPAPNADDEPPLPPLRIVTTNPDLRAALKRETVPVLRARKEPTGLRWSIVLLAAIGSLISWRLWQKPYVAPVHALMQNAGGYFEYGTIADRPIPAIYLWLWGVYCLLAVATQFFLPAPWRFGASSLRNNWVLNITTVVTILLFMSGGVTETANGLLDRNGDGVYFQEGGGYTYRHGEETRDITAQEAQQINARIIQSRDAATFKQWNLAALLSYLALGGYAAWWLIVRPEDDAAFPGRNSLWWLRQRRRDPQTASLFHESDRPRKAK